MSHAVINLKQLLHLSVQTERGTVLGKVCDLELAVHTHQVEVYIVKRTKLLPKSLGKQLRVHHTQVVSISPERMVVRDAVEFEADVSAAEAGAVLAAEGDALLSPRTHTRETG